MQDLREALNKGKLLLLGDKITALFEDKDALITTAFGLFIDEICSTFRAEGRLDVQEIADEIEKYCMKYGIQFPHGLPQILSERFGVTKVPSVEIDRCIDSIKIHQRADGSVDLYTYNKMVKEAIRDLIRGEK